MKKSKLNVLPENPELDDGSKVVLSGRFPKWLHRKLPAGSELWKTRAILKTLHLPTVCEEAKCPNLLECFSKKTATFLVMGKECTRNCPFCNIDFSATPKPLEKDEPDRIAQSVQALGLKHVVITMVARDDLDDGGARHLANIIHETRILNPETKIEILTGDFEGKTSSYDTVLAAKPEIFNYNIETVRRLTPKIRHRATYDRTLSLLRYICDHDSHQKVKSGLMVGLGETADEVKETICDLYDAGCDIITIGQYLQPSRHKFRVKAFITPKQFEEYANYGRSIGIKQMYCGPFVRSSYNAAALLDEKK
ncbi:MAG: Lipoyl synthase [Chlamydiae bacterium]|nr:Lipoyl synthase [Chlamydiota bacterium]NGX60411.1 Lipoyl synthase [Chlamydiota bacterium]